MQIQKNSKKGKCKEKENDSVTSAFLKFLSVNGITVQFIRNAKEENNNFTTIEDFCNRHQNYPKYLLINAFDWNSTKTHKEGFNYWQQFHCKWYDMCSTTFKNNWRSNGHR